MTATALTSPLMLVSQLEAEQSEQQHLIDRLSVRGTLLQSTLRRYCSPDLYYRELARIEKTVSQVRKS